MPNIWTHLIFGQQLMDSLGKKPLLEPGRHTRIFNLGCQGPDFLFYHNYLPWKKDKHMNRLGSLMHKEHCGPVLVDMISAVKEQGRELNDPAVLYVLGFLTHHVLDRNAHPYINYKSGFVKWNHQRLEVIIDTLMVNKHLGLETWKIPVWKQIDIGSRFPDGMVDMFERVIARYFPDLSPLIKPGEWNEAYRDMIQAQKLFHDPYGMKRVLTFGQIEPLVYKRNNAALDYLNEAGEAWNDPTSVEEVNTCSFWDLWERAMADGQAVLTEALHFLASESDGGSALLVAKLNNLSYETGKPCDSGLETKYVNPIL